MITTQRLSLIPATEELAYSEIFDPSSVAGLLQTHVPESWPPELMVDAFPWFYEQIRKNPADVRWHYWYVILNEPGSTSSFLVGSIGFKGRPDSQGMVEMGYSVLPEYRNRAIAKEMISALAAWAFSQDGVTCIIAETSSENRASCKVLEQNGFIAAGTGTEEGTIRFMLNNVLPT